MAPKTLNLPLSPQAAAAVRAGEAYNLNGVLYTARDAAHKRLVELLDKNQELPFDAQGQVIYYVGPCPAPPGKVIGSAGPTTSGRMDVYTPRLLAAGIWGLVGKGDRSPEVVAALKKHGAVYFAAVGGAGALIARHITAAQVVAFPELGPEAIYRLEVRDLPVVAAIDSLGNNYYVRGREIYGWKNHQGKRG